MQGEHKENKVAVRRLGETRSDCLDRAASQRWLECMGLAGQSFLIHVGGWAAAAAAPQGPRTHNRLDNLLIQGSTSLNCPSVRTLS